MSFPSNIVSRPISRFRPGARLTTDIGFGNLDMRFFKRIFALPDGFLA